MTHTEQSVPLPAVSGHSENSLTTHPSLWFERSDKSANKSGKFREAQLCFDISRWFKMPKHRESKTTKTGELQRYCCQGKSKAWGLQARFFPYSLSQRIFHEDARGEMAQESPSLCVPSEQATKSSVSCSRGRRVYRAQEMEGAGTMSNSLSSGSSGDRGADLKSFNSFNDHASSQPLPRDIYG